MSALRAAYSRLSNLIHELAKFGLVGAVNFGLYFTIYNVLLQRGVGSVSSNVVATVVSATSSYFMNRHWSFKHRARSGLRREYSLFFLLNGVGLVISSGCIGITDHVLGLDSPLALNVAAMVGQGLGTIFRFITYKKFVFLPPEDLPAVELTMAGGPAAAAPEAEAAVGKAVEEPAA